MAQKFASARLMAVLAVVVPLGLILVVRCGSTAVTGESAGDGPGIANSGVGDSPGITDGKTGATLSPTILGSAQNFGILGGQGVTNTGQTRVIGNLGVSPGLAITGFPPGTVTNGMVHAGDAIAVQAQADVTVAYNALKAEACAVSLSGQELSGLRLTPSVYCFATSAAITLPSNLVLDAQGDPNAVFIFQIGSTLTAGNNTGVRVINGGSACNVYWQVGSSATIGTGTAFAGNILALASITLMTGSSVSGRALARTAAVTLDTNDVSFATCAVAPPTADLAILVTSGQSAAAPGSTFTYLVTVTNRGPNMVQNVAMTTQLVAMGGPAPALVPWNCSATANSQCGMQSGTGNVNTTVSLAVGGVAAFVVTVTVPAQGAGTLEYRAQVAPSATVPDPDLTNNSATYTVSIPAMGTDMASGDAAASQPDGRLYGGGLTCNATGAGSSTSALFWVSMLVLGALARRRKTSARPDAHARPYHAARMGISQIGDAASAA